MTSSRSGALPVPSASATRWNALRRRGGRISAYLIVVALAALFFVPFFWTITTSLKRVDELYLFPPPLLPEYPILRNYPEVFRRVPMAMFLRNSAIVATVATIGTVVTTTLVAFGFARKRFPGRQLLFVVVLSTMMLPEEVTIIPKFLLYKQLGLIDTLWSLVLPEYFAVGAFYIFLTRQFMMTIPRDFDEAAMLDGAGSMRILASVLLPMIQPAVVTVVILSILNHWNDFFHPLIFLNTKENLTVSVGLRYFQGTRGAGSGDMGETREHLFMAASLMAAAPMVMLFFAAQRYFVRGIVMTGLKG
ncbi:MAG TPA: carbohydrate ABC transporter permease [Chloroflexota bacterium]|nr:carbohydrate ABC transporter permease [Chloroflexota bacterium]